MATKSNTTFMQHHVRTKIDKKNRNSVQSKKDNGLRNNMIIVKIKYSHLSPPLRANFEKTPMDTISTVDLL